MSCDVVDPGGEHVVADVDGDFDDTVMAIMIWLVMVLVAVVVAAATGITVVTLNGGRQ